MRWDIEKISTCARALLDEIDQEIESRSFASAGKWAARLLAALPPDDFADTEPGVSICYGMDEWRFKNMLPAIRHTVTAWRDWLADPKGDWPEPKTLRTAVAALEDLRASMLRHDQNASVS